MKRIVAGAVVIVVALVWWWRRPDEVPPRPQPPPAAEAVTTPGPALEPPGAADSVPPPQAPATAVDREATPRPVAPKSTPEPRKPAAVPPVSVENIEAPLPKPVEPARPVTPQQQTDILPPPPAPKVPPELRAVPEPGPVARAPENPSAVELAAVQRVVARYEQTYRQRDAKAVAAIWPTVDVRSLARVFERIQQQEMRFDTCAYAVNEGRASATCAGSLSYVPRVGSGASRSEQHTWSIQLERTGSEWSIVSVSAR